VREGCMRWEWHNKRSEHITESSDEELTLCVH
jgi:hypothetical protein